MRVEVVRERFVERDFDKQLRNKLGCNDCRCCCCCYCCHFYINWHFSLSMCLCLCVVCVCMYVRSAFYLLPLSSSVCASTFLSSLFSLHQNRISLLHGFIKSAHWLLMATPFTFYWQNQTELFLIMHTVDSFSFVSYFLLHSLFCTRPILSPPRPEPGTRISGCLSLIFSHSSSA